MEIGPFTAYLLKTAQLLCSAMDMNDNDIFTPEQFANQLEPAAKGEEVIRELNVLEVECGLYVHSASAYLNRAGRHKQWNRPTQKLIVDVLATLQKVQFWHLADWLERYPRDISQYWGLRRSGGVAVWVTREPSPQEKLHDGVQKLHEELGINLISL